MIEIKPLETPAIDVDEFAEFEETDNLFRIKAPVMMVFPLDDVRLSSSATADWSSCPKTNSITVEPTYRWDGPSGPTFDTPSLRLASLVHDIVCTKAVAGGYPVKSYFKRHRLYYSIARKQGAPLWRAQIHWHLLNAFNWMYSAARGARAK